MSMMASSLRPALGPATPTMSIATGSTAASMLYSPLSRICSSRSKMR